MSPILVAAACFVVLEGLGLYDKKMAIGVAIGMALTSIMYLVAGSTTGGKP